MDAPVPLEIRTAEAGARLEIAWSDGASTRIESGLLRQSSCSARSVRGRIEGEAPPLHVRIVGVEPVGLYAVNLRFSDGYDRGVFPWRVLRELGGHART